MSDLLSLEEKNTFVISNSVELEQDYNADHSTCNKANQSDNNDYIGADDYDDDNDNDDSSNIITETSTDLVLEQTSSDTNDLFVWPCVGIVANIPVQRKGKRYIGASGSKLRDELTMKGFNPVRVHPLWNYRGHTGYAVVEFRNDWPGFCDAMSFEKEYSAKGQGKSDYLWAADHNEDKGDKIYCWMGRDDDYNSSVNVIRDYLHKHGDLKTVSQYQEEEKNKTGKLVSDLFSRIEDKKVLLKEMEIKYIETSLSLSNLIAQKDAMLHDFNEEMENMRKEARGQLERISKEHERVTSELEAHKYELMQREEELEKREAHNEEETLKLYHDKKQNELAILEQKRADEKMLRLAEDHKREKEKLMRRAIELEKKLDAKQALELEIRRLQGKLQVAKHMGEGDDGDEALTKKLNSIEEELKEKEEELDDLEALNQALIIKERRSNEELQEARKEIVNGLKEQTGKALIGVKIDSSKASVTTAAGKRKQSSNDEADANNGIELWNYKDERQATVVEGISHVLKQWSLAKRKRR